LRDDESEDREIGDQAEPADAEKAQRPRQNRKKPANGVMVGARVAGHFAHRRAELDIATTHDAFPLAGGRFGAVSGRPSARCPLARIIRGRLSLMPG